jgi:hypothetical protein
MHLHNGYTVDVFDETGLTDGARDVEEDFAYSGSVKVGIHLFQTGREPGGSSTPAWKQCALRRSEEARRSF